MTSTGERFGTISGIVATGDGALWLNELRGVVRILPGEVRKILANHRASYQLLDYRDGMPGAPQMNFTVSTAVETTDGRLWFATDNGLARIDPAHLQTNNIPPPVMISSIVADRAYSPAANLRFAVGTEKIQVRYTALSLAIPERVTFRYRLEGVDDQWQDAGTRREAFYTNLRPA
jgi:ligand-binding sensor domain-containing protein